ncbi:hypothetical protein BKA81DRAFT_139662 [Phyllosticta paracitricarpa]
MTREGNRGGTESRAEPNTDHHISSLTSSPWYNFKLEHSPFTASTQRHSSITSTVNGQVCTVLFPRSSCLQRYRAVAIRTRSPTRCITLLRVSSKCKAAYKIFRRGNCAKGQLMFGLGWPPDFCLCVPQQGLALIRCSLLTSRRKGPHPLMKVSRNLFLSILCKASKCKHHSSNAPDEFCRMHTPKVFEVSDSCCC